MTATVIKKLCEILYQLIYEIKCEVNCCSGLVYQADEGYCDLKGLILHWKVQVFLLWESVIVSLDLYLGLDGLNFALQTADHAVELTDLSLGVPQLVPVLCGLAGHLVILKKQHKRMLDISSVCNDNATLCGVIMFKFFTL